MPGDISQNIPTIAITSEATMVVQWNVFRSICALANYDRAAIAEASEQLGLDLPAIKRHLNQQRTTPAAA